MVKQKREINKIRNEVVTKSILRDYADASVDAAIGVAAEVVGDGINKAIPVPNPSVQPIIENLIRKGIEAPGLIQTGREAVKSMISTGVEKTGNDLQLQL